MKAGDNMLKVGERIRIKREQLDMTQDELAQLTGYKSRSSINKIEKGGNDLPQSKIVAFAKALKTTPSYLMGWEDESAELEIQTGNKSEVQLDHSYLSFAKEAQDEGIDPDDIRLAIETIKAMRNKK